MAAKVKLDRVNFEITFPDASVEAVTTAIRKLIEERKVVRVGLGEAAALLNFGHITLALVHPVGFFPEAPESSDPPVQLTATLDQLQEPRDPFAQ